MHCVMLWALLGRVCVCVCVHVCLCVYMFVCVEAREDKERTQTY